MKYSITLEWSEEDQCYVVLLPEWAGLYTMPVTDGETYEEALANGKSILEDFIDWAKQDGETLPAPHTYCITS